MSRADWAKTSNYRLVVFSGFLLLQLLAVLCLPQLVHARGSREDPVEEAKRLIDERRHNEAMVILQEVIRRQPERIDEAERLLREIRGFRNEYNRLFSELLVHITTNPEDLERTLTLIADMAALDEHPNPRVQEQIAQSRIIAQLAFDRRTAERIQQEAQAFIGEGRHIEAAERYLDGLVLQQPEFEQRGYSQMLQTEVARLRTEARSTVAQAAQHRTAFVQASEALAQALQGDTTPAERARFYEQWLEEARRVEGTESVLSNLLESLVAAREMVELEFPDDPIDWHLNILRFMLGEPDNRERTGVHGSLARLIDDYSYQVFSAVQEHSVQLSEDADQALLAGRIDEAELLYRDIRDRAEYGVRLVLWASRQDPVDLPPPAVAAEQVRQHGRLLYPQSYAILRRSSSRAEAASELSSATERLGTEPGLDLGLDWERRSELQNARESFTEILSDWSTHARELRSAFRTSEDLEQYLLETGEVHDQLLSELYQAEITWVVELAEQSYTAVQAEYLGFLSAVETGETFLDGIPLDELADVELVERILARYPDQALELLVPTELGLISTESGLRELLDRYLAEIQFVQESPEFRTVVRNHEELLARVQATQLQVAALIETSETDIARAAELGQQGEALIAQTEGAIQQLLVPQAQSLWNQARDRFYESLALQEDPALRSRVEALAVSLGARIQDAANELVVQRVRELIDSAEDRYDVEEFLAAQELLNEARELWAQTNVEDNVEITRLTRLVNAALTFENERSVAETDPLFPVLGSYLSLAQDDFRRARTLVAQGSAQQAQPHLTRSEQNLENVIALRPFNWEAKVLLLRIAELRDSDNFDAVFERRYNEVMQNRAPGNALETLSDLQVLKEIKPNYPGIDRIIAELEIELGLRPDPVTQARAQRSGELYRQAVQVAGGGVAQDRAAIRLLEESVSLNPGNRDARLLLDTLRIRTGGQATVALSTTDEQQFRRAEQLFIQGNVAQAFGIVERLLQDESNQGYPPLIDLRRRIGSRLGV